jgi:hypothetical protein
LHGEQVLDRARELLASGSLPAEAPPVDRSPVDPDKGDHIENLIDPLRLADTLAGLGFAVRVVPHFGGAKSPWIAAANRILRGFGPAVLPWARSFKLVARRL